MRAVAGARPDFIYCSSADDDDARHLVMMGAIRRWPPPAPLRVASRRWFGRVSARPVRARARASTRPPVLVRHATTRRARRSAAALDRLEREDPSFRRVRRARGAPPRPRVRRRFDARIEAGARVLAIPRSRMLTASDARSRASPIGAAASRSRSGAL